MLLLLGDQLIRDPGIAVFELVKNAYDADSPFSRITMSKITDQESGTILIEDAGTGMDYETVTTVWLEPGTDYRRMQRGAGERTERYKRLPLGEKGVGRFAAHKLGHHVTLVTRKQGKPEIVVKINWKSFVREKYLEEVPVEVSERSPQVFTGERTGTRIRISSLRDVWTRGMLRNLARAISTICSPFKSQGDFKAELILTDNQDWLEGLITVDKVLEYSLFRAECDVTGDLIDYQYHFVPLPAMDKVTSRHEHKRLPRMFPEILTKYVGPIHIDLYIFDLEPRILALGVSDKKGLRDFLRENGGVRVYREGIRVYDYGEPGNDWLNLGTRRVNIPTRRISNNLVLGAVSLNLDKSSGLVEKTNREGFVLNTAYEAFQNAVTAAVNHIVAERNKDKVRIRNVYSSKLIKEPVLEDLSEVRQIVQEKGLSKELGPYLDRMEADFLLIRDRFLTSASAGLSLSAVIHEVEKGVKALIRAVKEEEAGPRIKALAKHLADLVEGFGSLMRSSGAALESASYMVGRAVFNSQLRLEIHGIGITVETEDDDFKAKCSRRLIIATLMNLIDNSVYWLETKWGDAKNKKKIFICTTRELASGPAIVVADTGPGFADPPEYLIEPFISRKPDGMGLGLHIADQVMRTQGGRLEFPEKGDLSLPEEFNGAVVALVFGGIK
jgi:signal transduction histidine kinase